MQYQEEVLNLVPQHKITVPGISCMTSVLIHAAESERTRDLREGGTTPTVAASSDSVAVALAVVVPVASLVVLIAAIATITISFVIYAKTRYVWGWVGGSLREEEGSSKHAALHAT